MAQKIIIKFYVYSALHIKENSLYFNGVTLNF